MFPSIYLCGLNQISVCSVPFTGELTLLGELDFETEPQLILTVVVSDGGIDGEDVLTGTATVLINVLNENEASPVFVDGPVYQVSVIENKEEVILTVSGLNSIPRSQFLTRTRDLICVQLSMCQYLLVELSVRILSSRDIIAYSSKRQMLTWTL